MQTNTFRVLICDSLEVVREEVRLALRNNPKFRVVDEAAECIVKVTRIKPDLVTMNVHMPDLDGAEATRLILLGVASTRIVAYWANAAWETAERMLVAGAGGYVVKGGNMDELVHAARIVLAGGHYLSLALFDPKALN
jgi:two-component system invasion response regulator UvrY